MLDEVRTVSVGQLVGAFLPDRSWRAYVGGIGLLVYVHRNYNEQGVQGREMYLELET